MGGGQPKAWPAAPRSLRMSAGRAPTTSAPQLATGQTPPHKRRAERALVLLRKRAFGQFGNSLIVLEDFLRFKMGPQMGPKRAQDGPKGLRRKHTPICRVGGFGRI